MNESRPSIAFIRHQVQGGNLVAKENWAAGGKRALFRSWARGRGGGQLCKGLRSRMSPADSFPPVIDTNSDRVAEPIVVVPQIHHGYTDRDEE
jgi:hypothetical protein